MGQTVDLLVEISDKLDTLQKQLEPDEPLPEELVITPTELATAPRANLEKWMRQLHIRVPVHMMREAVQRHLVKFGTLVEKPRKTKPKSFAKKVSDPPAKEEVRWKPEKGMAVMFQQDPSRSKLVSAVLGRTKKGFWLVKFKDGSKFRAANEAELREHVHPAPTKKTTKKRRRKKK